MQSQLTPVPSYTSVTNTVDRTPPGAQASGLHLPSALAIIAAMFASTPLGAQAPPAAAELANRIQARYAAVRDFSADFSQESSSPLQVQSLRDRGQVRVKKPDRMKWTYTSGDKNVMVADGSRYYVHFPKDRVVYERALPAAGETSADLLFLAGRGNLARDFSPSLPAKQPAAEWRLVLSPKSGRADFKSITVDVERVSFAIRGWTVTDDDGGVRAFRFSNVRENQNLPDRDFVFTMPRGVEVRRQ